MTFHSSSIIKNILTSFIDLTRQYDEESDLFYLNARMCDPKIARFKQVDTYLGKGEDPLSLNLYTYCHNELIMYWDPNGYKDLIVPGEML